MTANVSKSLRFGYANYRGERSVRYATPRRWWFGSTEYHPEPQWIMTALDHDKDQLRDFAVSDCDFSISEQVT